MFYKLNEFILLLFTSGSLLQLKALSYVSFKEFPRCRHQVGMANVIRTFRMTSVLFDACLLEVALLVHELLPLQLWAECLLLADLQHPCKGPCISLEGH